MRTAIITIWCVTLILAGQTNALDSKSFYSSGQIESGENWEFVGIYNDNTIVDMIGGQVGNIFTFNNSIFNLTGGQITKNLDIGPFGTTHISGGTTNINEIVFDTDSYGSISGGNIISRNLKMYNNSILDIRGGLVNINGFTAVDTPTINIYGSGFNYSGGIISGYLSDGNPFSIRNVIQSDYDRFNFIPEPATLLILGIGSLLLRKRN